MSVDTAEDETMTLPPEKPGGAAVSSCVPGSFRDPSGFLFLHDGAPYRQVNPIYQQDYDRLMESGLYAALVEAGLLIPHAEVDAAPFGATGAYKVLKPEPLRFIAYPYEWCYSQLKDAALTTLAVQKRALQHGMSLKDASAYNVQFRNGKPVFIDTLSFERRRDTPWVAYRQFCRHFLAPLALMRYGDIRLGQLLRIHIDGVPLDLASALLPPSTRLNPALLIHIHLHAKTQQRAAGSAPATGKGMSDAALLGLVDHLEGCVRKLTWQPAGTEWADYYEGTNYSSAALEHKKQIVARFLAAARPASVWDLGGNVGVFSRLASERGIPTLSFDIDPAAVEKNYRQTVRAGERFLLPLLLDLTNPSPGMGWESEERSALIARGPADTALALALVHHLAISNNVPLGRIAAFFGRVCRTLIIEFVPKTDSQVQRLLASREDVFPGYHEQAFESEFSRSFVIEDCARVQGSERTVYLMRKRSLDG